MTDQIPDFHAPERAGDPDYTPDAARIAAAADERRRDACLPLAHETPGLELLVVDNQKDFAAHGGALYVGGRSGEGAPRDSARLAEFVYTNLQSIARITPTLDTHHPHQIFFPGFWLGPDGQRPAPLTEIVSEDLRTGRWRPDPAAAAFVPDDAMAAPADWAARQALSYVEALEAQGRYALTIWPYHCLQGSRGHQIEGVFEAARLFHGFARAAVSRPILKGEDAWSESYSAFRPEVEDRCDGGALTRAPVEADRLLKRMRETPALVVAGQAASHCVKWSMDDLVVRLGAMRELGWPHPDVYLLADCTSSVAVPDGNGGFLADFTEESERAFRRWAEAGVHLVDSRTPLAEWPGAAGRLAS